jgi:hypothetical protein
MPPETKWSHEMPRRKNPATARSAAHSAPAPAPAPGPGPAPDSPAAAVHAALAARPGGATTAIIADAAGIGRPAARDALTAMQTDGTVTRTKGGKPGVPDTWTLVATEGTGNEPGTGPGQEYEPAVSQPGDDPASQDQDGLSGQEATDGPGQQEASDGQASTSPAPGTGAAGQAAQPDGTPADGGPGEPDTATGPEHGDEPAGGGEPGPSDSPAAGDSGPAGEQPDPALVAEVTGRIEQIQSAASAAAIVLTGGGNLLAALAGLDEIYDQAGQARRALKAAVGGRKAPAARPGGLREKVLGHLRDHPGKEFTPHEIHKVLGNSSGAIANALDTLVKLGDAELATEKPRKFRLASAATAPAGPGGAGGDGELAGAA